MKTTNADRGSAAPEDEDITSFNVVFVTTIYHFKECCQRMRDRGRKPCATDRQGWQEEALLILLRNGRCAKIYQCVNFSLKI